MKPLIIIVFIFSLLFNLFVGWSPAKGEPVIITGIKRFPSLYTEVAYPEIRNNTYQDVEVWYYEVGLPMMYRLYHISALENDFFIAKVISFISWIWVIMLVGYLIIVYLRVRKSISRE